jgi:hypothetical protein
MGQELLSTHTMDRRTPRRVQLDAIEALVLESIIRLAPAGPVSIASVAAQLRLSAITTTAGLQSLLEKRLIHRVGDSYLPIVEPPRDETF